MPFWFLLFLTFIVVLGLMLGLVIRQDRFSVQSAERVFASIEDERFARLSDILLEYAFWDEAADNIVHQYNPDWIKLNFDPVYLEENLGISAIVILDQRGAEVFSAGVSPSLVFGSGPGSLDLMAQDARKAYSAKTGPGVVSVYLQGQDNLYKAVAATITDYDDAGNIDTGHVMIFMQRLDAAWIAAMAERFHLSGLILQKVPGDWQQASLPLKGIAGNPLAYYVWTPILPGTAMIPWLAAMFLIIVAAIVFATLKFVKGAQSVTAELVRLSSTDSLTGLWNRSRFNGAMVEEFGRFQRHQLVFSIILIDIDHFKQVNDTHGHHLGDQVLQAFANLLTQRVRDIDMVARWGGEEFIVLCPHTDASGAMALAESLRVAIEGCDFPAIGQKTSSLGVATVQKDENPEQLIARADQALYAAKRGGRNRVCAIECPA